MLYQFSNLRLKNILNKNIGNPFGIMIKNKIIMPDTPRHYYFKKKNL